MTHIAHAHAELIGCTQLLVADLMSREGEESLFEAAGLCALLKLRRGTVSDDLAVIDDRDRIGHAVGLLHVVRGEEHRDAFGFIEGEHVLPHVIARLWVQTDGRLVEEENLGVMKKPARDLEPPLHAAREFSHETVLAVRELHDLEQLLDALAPQLLGKPIQNPVDFHVLPRRKLVIHAGILKDDAERLTRGILIRHRIVPVDFDFSARGPEQRRKHLDRGRLSGAVGTEKSEDLPMLHFKRDVVHGREVAKFLGHLRCADDGRHEKAV